MYSGFLKNYLIIDSLCGSLTKGETRENWVRITSLSLIIILRKLAIFTQKQLGRMKIMSLFIVTLDLQIVLFVP